MYLPLTSHHIVGPPFLIDPYCETIPHILCPHDQLSHTNNKNLEVAYILIPPIPRVYLHFKSYSIEAKAEKYRA